MNKKQWVISIIVIILLLIIGWGLYFYFGNEDEKTTLTLAEKQWIERHKNNVVDIGIVQNVPIFNYEGDGLFFEFLKDIEKDTGLEFNEISYDNKQESNTEYSFQIKDKLDDNDILIHTDNYALVGPNKTLYNSLSSIPNMVVGVTKDNLEYINFYLYDNKNITYKVYDNYTELFDAISISNTQLGAIAVPKTIYLKQILTKKLNINYNIESAKINLTLNLGNNKKLNTIIRKYYKMWNEKQFDKIYQKNLLNNYFTFNEISEDYIASFGSKQYKYGFINHAPFTTLVDGNLVGISKEYMSNFAKLANIEINYQEYKSLHDLIKDFNQNKLDFFFNTSSEKKYDMDVYETVSITDENIEIISGEKNNLAIDSLSSLKDQEVIVIAKSKIVPYLKGYGIKTKEVNNFDNILNDIDNTSIIAMDQKAFDLYRHNKLQNFRVYYTFNLNSDYNYTIRDIQANQIFEEFFNFYISFTNHHRMENQVTHDMYIVNVKNHLGQILICIIAVIVIGTISFIIFVKKPFKDKKITVSKDNKIKYIDMLTSLKNRNYLNDTIEKWDSSEIYPQAIIIVDLNNIAYVNDNYGHEEGDNVIKQAANILITTQIENSEIMRTNGNEFLIYMVEHDEKQVITYIRSLTKEFKELNHGFGAAIGYSMIIDGLKTVDDAINEATLDMKSNKEEIQN